jgi:hypothetical protein
MIKQVSAGAMDVLTKLVNRVIAVSRHSALSDFTMLLADISIA